MTDFGSMLANALTSLADIAGERLLYRRGDDWIRTRGVGGTSTFDLDDGNGVVVEYRTKDWLIRSCELRLGGEQITPERGDVIEQQIGSKINRYEVLRPDGGDQVWRYIDHGQSTIRVHTKLKETADA